MRHSDAETDRTRGVAIPDRGSPHGRENTIPCRGSVPARGETESPLSHFREPPVYSQTVSRTLELSLQSSFQLSLTVLVRYRSRGRIQS